MGCCGSKSGANSLGRTHTEVAKHYSKPKWKANPPMTQSELERRREEFWDTAPHYGGDRVIWDALKAVCGAPDVGVQILILQSAEIIVASPDLTLCYDERGAKYDLPKYVLSAPANLVKEKPSTEQRVEMVASRSQSQVGTQTVDS